MRSSHSSSATVPLHVTIAASFTLLLVGFGATLIIFNYLESRKTALLAADEQASRIASHLELSVHELLGPAQHLIDVSSKLFPGGGLPEDDQFRYFATLAEALRLQPEISAAFVGFDTGDFFLVRALAGREHSTAAINAPSEAAYVVQRIDRSSNDTAEESLVFLSRDLDLVERRSVPWSGFDPRDRSWFSSAGRSTDQVASDFYIFFTTREVGVTIARQLSDGGGVVGADLSLDDLNAGLSKHRATPSMRLLLLGENQTLVALADPEEQIVEKIEDQTEKVHMPRLEDLRSPIYAQLSEGLDLFQAKTRFELEFGGETWLISVTPIPTRGGDQLRLVTLTPRSELLTGITRTRNQSAAVSLVLLALTIVAAIVLARNISRPLRTLALEAKNIREMRFEDPITVRSKILEVDELAEAMAAMKSSIHQFLAISHALSAEKSFDHLLRMVLDEARQVSNADAAAIFLRSEDEHHLEPVFPHSGSSGATAESAPGEDHFPIDRAAIGGLAHRVITTGEVVMDDAPDNLSDSPLAAVLFDSADQNVHSLLGAPLPTQQGKVIGMILLANARSKDGAASGFRPEIIPYIEALCSDAAVALDNRRLLRSLKNLLESFIHVLAGAIDAKSPYTHGHCQRVPEIGKLLAEAAHEAEDGPFETFALSQDEWFELHLASWLHDCGKVTTPEYVVDKATKLETLYNRIHEIRTRFEVLWRDAEIDYWKAHANGSADDNALLTVLKTRRRQLNEDFKFIAGCNLGDAPLSDEDVTRLETIGQQSWVRHLDNRLGLSHLELDRLNDVETADLPVREKLLGDRPEHVVRREDAAAPFGDNPHGFDMLVPPNRFDFGELTNLSIRRGTLTPEERFKINEHIIETIRMLERLPFPKELKRVPRWAGSHHERLDGTGYPRRLSAKELSVPERILAIADIFEALTAVDRPYLAPKKLSKAIDILASMAAGGHVCPELFRLFLSSGVYLEYAQRHLENEQLDEVDVAGVLARLDLSSPGGWNLTQATAE